MTMLRGVIVGHGQLAQAMLGAVEQIAGVETGLVAVSNTDCDRGALEARIVAAVDGGCLLYTSPSPRDRTRSRMPASA